MSPGKHELKAQFVELRATDPSYAMIAKKLKVVDENCGLPAC